MAKVLFDLTAAQATKIYKYHGGADYAIFIFNELINSKKLDFHVIYNPSYYIDPEILLECARNNITVFEISNNDDIKAVIAKGDYQKFYSAMPYGYSDFDFPNIEFIMVIHGLRTLEMPSDIFEIKYANGLFLKLKKVLKKVTIRLYITRTKAKYNRLLRIKNKVVITVSEHSKYSILAFHPFLSPEDIKVFYSPIKLLYQPEQDKKDYFLLISANRWEKNNYRAIQAFDQLFSEGLLIGKRVKVLGCANSRILRKVNNSDRFEFLDYVDQKELEQNFREAYAFIYPSLNEGFGYPPLIAMRYSTPVLASAISAIPEVCGQAALYFNPFSVNEIKNRLLMISDDNNLYESLQKKGREQILNIAVKIKDMNFENINLLIS